MTSGTSAAAAEVSGVAALILDRNRKLDAAAIRRILMSTARDLGAPGHDDQFGSGLVDALGRSRRRLRARAMCPVRRLRRPRIDRAHDVELSCSARDAGAD